MSWNAETELFEERAILDRERGKNRPARGQYGPCPNRDGEMNE